MLSRRVFQIALLAAAPPMLAQSGATVQGIVRDSIAQKVLAGARVQIVSVEGKPPVSLTEVTDSLGGYTLRDVPDGRYMMGFFHPILDSLGVEAPLREVRIESHRSLRVDLATPTGRQIRAAICGAQAQSPAGATDSGAVIIGTVRNAGDRAVVTGAKVTGEWLEMSFGKDGVRRRVPRLTAVTGENGWFALCNVPSGGNVMLSAAHDADSTDLVEVRVSLDGFLRRELFVGAGRERLTGTVTSADGGRPVVGAQVGIANGPQTHTNERGEWTIVDAPAGTRTLEVRAVTYYPERRTVDVIAGAPAVRISLSTMKAVLDTIRVTASTLYNRDRNGFLLRKRSTMGRFLTGQEVERRGGAFTTSALRTMPGVRVDVVSGSKRITLRGAFGSCAPEFYVNGLFIAIMDGDDLDAWAPPGRVTGIEVYAGPPIPFEFQHGMSTCGSIVVWTR